MTARGWKAPPGNAPVDRQGRTQGALSNDAPSTVEVVRREQPASIGLTMLVLSAATFHLAAFGLLPFGTKWIGDALLGVALVWVVLRDGLQPKRGLGVMHGGAILLFFLSSFALLNSALLWGLDESAVRWSRRWFVASAYMFLVALRGSARISSKAVKRYLAVAAVITASLVVAERYALTPADTLRSSIEVQGGVVVEKVFAPGIALLLFVLIRAAVQLMRAPSARAALHAVLILVLSMATIRYRGYWLAAGIALTIAAATFKASPRLSPRFAILSAAVVGAVACTLALTPSISTPVLQAMDGPTQWIVSALSEAQAGTGNIAFRIETDWSRVEWLLASREVLDVLLGVGFVGEGSEGSRRLGFTTETTDTGFVEALLTSGGLGLVMLLAVGGTTALAFVRIGRRRHDANAIAAGACWVVAIVTMASSNMLLWDYGFVPLGLVGLLVSTSSVSGDLSVT